MANSIELVSKSVALLDEVYKYYSLTQDLESDSTIVRQGTNANEILYPKMSMDGLGNYDRNDGYVNGSASLEWETVKFNYDRGRTFSVDAMDNEETINVAFGKLSSEFVRTKVVPELDAVRFATYCGATGIGTKSEALTTGDGVFRTWQYPCGRLFRTPLPIPLLMRQKFQPKADIYISLQHFIIK